MVNTPFIYCKNCQQISRRDYWVDNGTPWPSSGCVQCHSADVIRWCPWVCQWTSIWFKERFQRVYGTPEQLFSLCIALGKSPNTISIDINKRYAVDIGPRHIMAYNRLVGIETFAKGVNK